jgi:hypothetical protein
VIDAFNYFNKNAPVSEEQKIEYGASTVRLVPVGRFSREAISNFDFPSVSQYEIHGISFTAPKIEPSEV